MNHNAEKLIKLARWWLAFCLLGWGCFTAVQAAECTTGAGNLADLVALLAEPTCDPVNLTGTITVSTAQTLDGNGKTISGNNTFRLFLVSNSSGEVVFNDLTLSGGSLGSSGSHGCADNNGAGICKQGAGTLTINRSVIKNNTANRGGGIYIANGTLNVQNTVLMGNAASSGGAIYDYGGLTPKPIVNIVGSTITANNATDTTNIGGGVFTHTSTNIFIKNSIIASNNGGGGSTSEHDCDTFSSGSVTSQGYNLFLNIANNVCLANAVGTDQTTANLVNIFSSAPTLKNDAVNNLALNAIPNSTNGCGSSPFNEDYLGTVRPQNTDCDIGAHELSVPEIEILAGSDPTELVTGNTVDLGSVAEGGALNLTLTFKNTGLANLTFNNFSGLPTGFNSGDTFPTTIAAAGTATYTISLSDTSTANTFSGSISFDTSDSDESSFTLNLTGEVVATASAPADPSAFSAAAASDTSIDLSWTDNSNNEANFILTWIPNGSTAHSENANTESTTITGLSCNTSYSFTLLARNGTGDSAPVTASATTNACPAPTAPSGLTVNSTTTTTANLSWADNSNDETGFVLERKTGAGSFGVVATLNAGLTGTTDTSLSCNTAYTYRLKATNNGNDSAYTTEVSATTATCPTPPSAPTGLNVTSTSTSSANLTWTDSDTETSFILERKTGSGGTYSQVATLNANTTSTINSGLSCGTTYYYQLKASNSGGDSAYSNPATATTSACIPPPPPTYSLTVNVNPSAGGTITGAQINCGSDCSGTYSDGTEVSLTLSLNKDYIFKNWSNCSSNTTSALTVTMNSSKTCTANVIAQPTVTLTTKVVGNGSVQVTPATGKGSCGMGCTTYDQNTVVSLSATPDDNYTFTGWTGSCNGTTTPYSQTLSVNATCTANFVELPKYLVSMTVTGNGTISSNPAGIDACSDSCSAEFGQTQTVSFTPTAATGWVFVQFAGDADCTDGNLTINGAVNCSAEFAEAGSVAFELANYAGTEGDDLTLTLLRQGGSAGAISVDYSALGITATATDYSTANGTVTWAEGDSDPKTITLSLIADDLVETAETFQLNLSNVQGGATLGTQSSTEIKIFDLAAFASLQFATARYVVNEIDGVVNVIVTRAANNRGEVTIDYATLNGTAVGGEDYTLNTGTLVWADGDSTHKVIPINIVLDLIDDIDETFRVVLGNPQPASDKLVIGDIGQTEIQIINTPVSGTGLVQFSAPVSEANENSGVANLNVSRLGGSTGAISVDYSINGGTATAGKDYALGGNGTLTWSDGDATDKPIPLAVFADAEQEGTETITLALQNADGGAVIGAQNQALLNLIDNYSDPATTASSWVVRFVSADFTALEDQGGAVISVQREGDASVAINVAARTQNGTAIAGQDYSAVDTVLTWGIGDLAPKNFTVPVTQDNLSEGSENVTLSLYNPSAGVILANPSVANLRLLDASGNTQTTVTDYPSRVQFESDTFRVTETQGTVAVRLARLQSSKGLLRVPIILTLEDASTNDFINDISTVEWADGEMGVKVLNIGILNDSQLEGKESFLLTLGQPNLSSAVLGPILQARVEIYDQTVVQFDAAEYSVDENGGSVVLTVTRIGNALDSTSVQYTTLNDSAKAGTDYQTSTGTLTWATEQTEQVLSVDIRNNAEKDGSRQFKVRLQTPQNATLGLPSETTVLIVDDEASICAPPTIDCRYNNIGKTLTNVRIMPNGTVIGGTLGGTIENFGTIDGSSSAITFLPNTVVQEIGTLRGRFSTNMSAAGEGDELARLREVSITAGSRLSNVIISTGTVLNSAVTLLSGVLFDANGLIPARINLANILGRLGEAETDGTQAINLLTDVLLYSAGNGIIGAINYNLSQDAKQRGETVIPTVSQHMETGVLTLTRGNQIGTYLPVSVTQYDYEFCTTEVATADENNALCVPQTPFGMREQADGSIIFVTHTFRQIIAVPFMQSMRSLRSSFAAYDLNDISWFDGVVYVQFPENEDFFSAQAGARLDVPFNGAVAEYGSVQLSPLLGETTPEAFFVLRQTDVSYARQFLYPAAAYPEVIRALSYQQQAVLHNNGLASIPLLTEAGLVTYHGLFDYVVLAGVAGLNTGRLQITPIADMNGDGVSDYEVIYPNDARQVLFRLR